MDLICLCNFTLSFLLTSVKVLLERLQRLQLNFNVGVFGLNMHVCNKCHQVISNLFYNFAPDRKRSIVMNMCVCGSLWVCVCVSASISQEPCPNFT